jgi:rRNA maturation endonuclease Nob1
MSYDLEQCPNCNKKYDPYGMSTVPKITDKGFCPHCGFDLLKDMAEKLNIPIEQFVGYTKR